MTESIHWLRVDTATRQALRDAISGIASRMSGIRLVYLYGSAARQAPQVRDIDLGVAVDPAFDLDELKREIADAARINPAVLDVRSVSGAGPVFLYNMLRDGELLYASSQSERIEFEVYVMSCWLDFRPVYQRMRQRALEGWAHG